MGALIASLLAAAATILAPAATAQPAATEAQVKAAFLYRFGGFVEWPEGTFARADAPFAIGVLGGEAVAAELERITAGRRVQDRPVAVRRLRRGEATAGLQVLFVGSDEAARLPEVLAAAKSQALLVVAESDSALAQGATINFVPADDKVRFDVALPAAERGGLRISSRLLAVARKVVPS